MTGNGTNSQRFTVNALDFALNNVPIAGVGTVSGDVIFGQSVASMMADQSSTGAYMASATAGTLADPQLVTGTGPFTSIVGSIGGSVSKKVFGVHLSGGALNLTDTTNDGSALYLGVFDSNDNPLMASGGTYQVGAGNDYFAVATDPNHPDPGFTLTSSLPFDAFNKGGSTGGTAVPEPSSLGLLGVSLLGFVGLRRRRAA